MNPLPSSFVHIASLQQRQQLLSCKTILLLLYLIASCLLNGICQLKPKVFWSFDNTRVELQEEFCRRLAWELQLCYFEYGLPQRLGEQLIYNGYICSSEESYPRKEWKDIKYTSETKMHARLPGTLSLMWKPKTKLKDMHFIFCFFIVVFFYLLCILYIFMLLCHAVLSWLVFISVFFFWVNTLLLISEIVNCKGYRFQHILLLVMCNKQGEQ